MDLAKENELIVTDIIEDGGAVDDESVERLNTTYTLNIFNEKDSNTIQLKFPGTHSVLDVKKDVYTVTNIAVRHQEWIGWPSSVRDNTPLALTGIPIEHDFILKSREASNSSNAHLVNAGENNRDGVPDTIEVDSDSSVDEFEDASDFNGDEDLFTAPVTNNRIKHLSKINYSIIITPIIYLTKKKIVFLYFSS